MFYPILRAASILLICGTLVRCNSAADEAFTAMDQLLKSENLSHSDSLEYRFNEGTFAYLEKVQDLAKRNNMPGLEALGKEHDCPITTTILGKTLQPIAIDSSGSLMEPGSVMFLLDLMGFGIYRHSLEQPFKAYEAVEASNDQALINVTVPTGVGNAKLLFAFRMEKEGDRWKLDYPSTLRYHEAIFRQSMKRQGLSVTEFADQYINSENSQLEFHYRASM